MPDAWTGRLLGTMHNKGITYEDLAKELGVSKPYISMILNGRRRPDGIRKRMETAVGDIVRRRERAEAEQGADAGGR